jgi:methionyl-tRNA formyltransferase
MSDQINIVFLGSPAFSCPFLKTLAEDPRFHIQSVITQEDKPTGRDKTITPTPVKELAVKLDLPVYQPASLNKDLQLLEQIQQYTPDFLVTVAYGQIVSQKVLSMAKIKPINVHGSILPIYRGASPIEQSLLNGDPETGLSIMEMLLQMDAGPVYATIRESILPDDNAATLRSKLSEKGAKELPDLLVKIQTGELKAQPQNDQAATYCQKISKIDGLIDPANQTAKQIYNRFRAFYVWPGIYLTLNNKQLKLTDIKTGDKNDIEAGKFVINSDKLYLGCQKDSLEILQLQLEGKKNQSTEEFLRGNSRLFQ